MCALRSEDDKHVRDKLRKQQSTEEDVDALLETGPGHLYAICWGTPQQVLH